jgi:hypothetical protein
VYQQEQQQQQQQEQDAENPFLDPPFSRIKILHMYYNSLNYLNSADCNTDYPAEYKSSAADCNTVLVRNVVRFKYFLDERWMTCLALVRI